MFSGIDFLVVFVYLIIIISVGLLISRKKSNTSEYFLANRNIGFERLGKNSHLYL
jgi:Na+/proline symporter